MKAHSCTHKHACLPEGSGGMLPPRKILNLDPLRLLLMKSGTRLLFNTCDETIITILNFNISGGEGNFQGSPPPPPPPLYETCLLDNQIFEVHKYIILTVKHSTPVSLQVVHPVTMEQKVLTYSISGLQSALSETNYLLSVH